MKYGARFAASAVSDIVCSHNILLHLQRQSSCSRRIKRQRVISPRSMISSSFTNEQLITVITSIALVVGYGSPFKRLWTSATTPRPDILPHHLKSNRVKSGHKPLDASSSCNSASLMSISWRRSS